MDSIWSKLRHHSKPSENFKENLRADLFEKITKKDENFFVQYIQHIKIPKSKLVLKIERAWSLSSLFSDFFAFISSFFSQLNYSILKIGALFVGGFAAAIVILPLFSVVSVPNSLALNPSMLRSLEGNIDILRSNDVFNPIEYQEIYQWDTITTHNNSSAELVFFDGTVIRISENTSIRITQINQNPLLFSAGNIQVSLLEGAVWVKTFKNSSLSSEDGILITTPSLSISPNKSALSVHYQGGKEWVYDIDNSSIIGIQGVNVEDNLVLNKGEVIQFSIFDEFTPLNEIIPRSFYDGEWVTQNIAKDVSYTTEYLDTISEKMQEKYLMSAFSLQVEEFLKSNPSDEELELFINNINSLMLVLESSNTQEKQPEDATDNLEIIESIEKSKISTYVPRRTVQPIPSLSENNKFTIEQEPEQEEMQTGESIEETNENNRQKIIEDEIFIITPKRTAAEIAAQRRAEQKEAQINAAVESFSKQVDAFTFENSRKTTALNLLDKIPENAENLELLKRIEMNAPDDVKNIIEEKIENIEPFHETSSLKIEQEENNDFDVSTIEKIDTKIETRSDIKVNTEEE